MRVMRPDEGAGGPERDGLHPELPVQHQAADVVVGQAAQLVAGERLGTDAAQQLASPSPSAIRLRSSGRQSRPRAGSSATCWHSDSCSDGQHVSHMNSCPQISNSSTTSGSPQKQQRTRADGDGLDNVQQPAAVMSVPSLPLPERRH